MKKTLSAVMLAALAGTAGHAQAQVFVGNTSTGTNARLAEVDIASGTAINLLSGVTEAVADAMAFDPETSTLYWTNAAVLRKGSYAGGALTGVTIVGNLRAVGTTTPTLTAPGKGMAYDTAADQLVIWTLASGTAFPQGFYSVDVNTAEVTQISTTTGLDFGGIDYDPSLDAFFGSNDSTSTTTVPGGRGIYRINKPLSSPTYTEIAEYPGTDTDIDGVGAGGGVLYLVNDTNAQPIYTLDAVTGIYGPSLPSPFLLTTALFSAGAVVAAPAVSGVNLAALVGDVANCSIPEGGPVAYTVTVRNFGPDPSTASSLAFTVTTSNVTGLSSPSGGTVAGDTITIPVGPISSGSFVNVVINGTHTAGTVSVSATVTGAEADPFPGNNTGTDSFIPTPSSFGTGNATAIFSNAPGFPSATIPGSPGETFDTVSTPGKLVRSPDGSRFMFSWDTSGATTNDNLLIIVDSLGARVAARENDSGTALPGLQGSGIDSPPFFVEGAFGTNYGINDNGDFTFACTVDRPATTEDGLIVKNVGGVYQLVAQEAVTPAPSATGGTFFSTTARGSFAISNNGTVSGVHSVAGLTTATDTFLLTNDLKDIVAAEGVTAPAGGVGFDSIQLFDSGTASLGFFLNADHSRYIYSADLQGDTAFDDIVVVDGTIVSQEGVIVPGSSFATPVTSHTAVRMEGDGTWFVRGTNSGSINWVMRNGAIIAQTGDPVPGSSIPGETYNRTFFQMAGNPRGDYVFGAETTNSDVLRDGVLVLNGTTVISRQGDPVDVDGDGDFDEGYFIRIYTGNDEMMMTDEAVYINVELRSANAQFCSATDTAIADAVLRIPLPEVGCPCPFDYNNSGSNIPDIDDLLAFFEDFNNGLDNADVNCTGAGSVPDVDDLLFFFDAFNGTGSCAP